VNHRIRTARPASEELAEAIQWYENRRRGLGRDLYASVVASMDSIATHPEIGGVAFDEPGIRRVLVARFPYQIVYRVDSSEIVILAFAHLKRRPGFWKHRR
jgi:plasmid stabilization system protein ParE